MKNWTTVAALFLALTPLWADKSEVEPAPSASEAPTLVQHLGDGEKPSEEALYTINYNNVAVIEYIRYLSKITGTNFVFNPDDLQFKMTLVSEGPTTIENLMSVLLQVLQVHGLSLMEQGNQILIYKNANLGSLATVVSDQTSDINRPPIVTRVFHVEGGSPEETLKIIQPLLSEAAAIQASPATGHLIVTDVASTIEKVADLLQSIDQMEVAYYEVRYSYADSIVLLAQKILAPLGGKEVTLVAQPSSDTIFVVANPFMVRRTLGILQMLDVPSEAQPTTIVTPDSQSAAKSRLPQIPTSAVTVTRAAALAAQRATRSEGANGEGKSANGERAWGEGSEGEAVRINERAAIGIGTPVSGKSDEEATTFSMYKLQYHTGDEIRDALQDIAASLKEAEGESSNLVKTISTVQWIKSSNSLVISGNKSSIARVNALIEDLDIPLREVLIETLVIRTTMSNSLNIGVEWGFKSTFDGGGGAPDVIQTAGGSTKGSPGGTPSALNARLNPLQVPTPIPLAEGLAGGAIGRFVSFNGKLFTSLGLLVDSFQGCQDTTVMLNPKILTLDNNEAEIFVGANIAFQASTITQPGSETVVGQISYRDVGTTLKIKPILSNSDMVTIEITQEISQNDDAVATTNVATVAPTLKSTTKTRVTVPDGYFLITSGQTFVDRRSNHRGLPCLGGLPIIGTCFSTREKQDSRDNLIIFMRPHIIGKKSEMVHITECEKLRYDRASQPGQYQMDLETILDVLNIKREEGKPCRNPLDCCCGFPCDQLRANTHRPPCNHTCDDFCDDYWTYPCEPCPQ